MLEFAATGQTWAHILVATSSPGASTYLRQEEREIVRRGRQATPLVITIERRTSSSTDHRQQHDLRHDRPQLRSTT